MSQSSGSRSSQNGDGKIIIHVKDQLGTEVRLRISRSAKLEVLMIKYCKEKQLEYNTVRFIYEGARVLRHYTPENLNMEDGAEIFCMRHQRGGGNVY